MSIKTVLNSIPSLDHIAMVNALVEKYNLHNLNQSSNLVDIIESSQDIVKLCSMLTPQGKARELENLLAKTCLNGADLISPSLDMGDAKDASGKLWELKTSTSNATDALNLRQIRPWQQVDFYLCSYINETNPQNSRFYVLTKQEMWEEVQLLGSPTHGLTSASAQDETVEWSVTIYPYSDSREATERWNEKYLSDDMRHAFLGTNHSVIEQQKTLW